MNEAVKKILDKSKRDFLIAHGLYIKEYAPYNVRIVGYDVNDISKVNNEYFITTDKRLNISDIVDISVNGNHIQIQIQSIDYLITENLPAEYNYTETDHLFPYSERRYKIKNMEITDEEYALLKRELPPAVTPKPVEMPKDAGTPFLTILCNIIGALFLLPGLILGIIVGKDMAATGWIIFFCSVLVSLQFFVFAKIIQLLNVIAYE